MFDIETLLENSLNLAFLPTPIENHTRLSNKYSVNFSIKRDDLTESIIGGTKLRLLEYVLKDAVNQGITDLITIGDIYSNQCRIVTQLTKKFDMNAHLFINSNGQNYGSSMEENLFISYLAGASITYLSGNDWKFYSLKVERLKKQLIKNKRMPLFIQSGIAGLPGSLGIIKMVREIFLQNDNSFPYTHIITPVGSAGTLFGLDLAFYLLPELKTVKRPILIGVSIFENKSKIEGILDRYYSDFNKKVLLNLSKSQNILLNCDYIGSDYHIITEDKCLALIRFVREYGLLLDPYYCLIPMLGTINLIEKKIIKSGSNILFIMTGQPYGLFSNRTELLRMVKNT
ncbi:MAG: pyridoxal-phosphate dependent enzyme [Nitrospirae bacterium]|nr:pyridoxal-phosphate dependent enzyme [Nitrospirota bacterium]